MFLGKRKERFTREDADAILERAKTEAPLDLEKGDIPAMFIAAVRVFLPFVLAICGTLLLVWFFIFYIWGGIG